MIYDPVLAYSEDLRISAWKFSLKEQLWLNLSPFNSCSENVKRLRPNIFLDMKGLTHMAPEIQYSLLEIVNLSFYFVLRI